MPEKSPAEVRGALLHKRRSPSHANDQDPPPGKARVVNGSEVMPGKWTPDHWGLPPRCPVEPLGMHGEVMYVQDALGQLQLILPNSLGIKTIQMLFGARQGYLYWAWPRFPKKGAGVDISWRAEKVAESLYNAAHLRGVFDAADRVRGRGAWRDPEGGLIYHSGSSLWRMAGGRFEELGIGHLDGMFYPARPAIAPPWPERVEESANPCALLVPLLQRWAWERPLVDPVLFVGWIGAALLGGALPWRPTVFVVGDRATGKSTLQTLAKGVLAGALLSTADTTAAGIYQRVQQDSLAIAVDELEAEIDNRKADSVIKLARLAASGSMMFRGGANHVGTEFRAQSAFMFSSINPPSLAPQDVSRMAILRLNKLPKDAAGRVAPALSVDADVCGPRLLRRMLDGWSRFERVFAEYRTILQRGGHDGRGQDTLGTLLACADLLIGEELADHLDLPRREEWSELLKTSSMLEYEDAEANWHSCIKHLLNARVEAWRGGLRLTVGQLIDDVDWSFFVKDIFKAAKLEIDAAPDSAAREAAEERMDELVKAKEKRILALEDARRMLGQTGLGLLSPGELPRKGETRARRRGDWILAVPHEHPGVSELYRNTPWGGASGRSSVWKSAMRQAPENVVCVDPKVNRVYIAGSQIRCTLIRLKDYNAAGDA